MTRTAKDLFWHYACNHFFLDRDGALEEYIRLGGSRDKENAWRDEYIAHYVSKIDTDDLSALRALRYSEAHEAIPDLLLEDYGDDYSKFWFAFTLAELARIRGANPRNAAMASQRAISLWQEILENPVGIIIRHKHEITPGKCEALGAHSPEEYVRNYTVKKLKEIKRH